MKKQKLTAVAVALGLSLTLPNAAHAGSYQPVGTPSYSPAEAGGSIRVQVVANTFPASPVYGSYGDSPGNHVLSTHSRSWQWVTTLPIFMDPPPSQVSYKWVGDYMGPGLSVSIYNSPGAGTAKVSFGATMIGSETFEIPTTTMTQTQAVGLTGFTKTFNNQTGGSNISCEVTLLVSASGTARADSVGSDVEASSGSAVSNKYETSSIDLLP